MDWLREVTDQVAAAHGLDQAALHLQAADTATILDVARVASHASGNRINAPLLCFALGVAHARGATIEDLAASVRSIAGDPDGESSA